MNAWAEAPMIPKAGDYLPVEDLPPQRAVQVMTPDERLKLKNELIAARDRQTAKAREGAARVEPKKP
jgi:hypothetical protein